MVNEGSEFFNISKVIDKDAFISGYRETSELAQLLLAPFGLSEKVSDVLNQVDAQQEFGNLFRLWEDVLSRRVYAWKGYSDDRVAASMHQYVDVDRDVEVARVIREASGAVSDLLEVPSVIDMCPKNTTSDEEKDQLYHLPDICTADITAEVLEKVLLALETLVACTFAHMVTTSEQQAAGDVSETPGPPEQQPANSLFAHDVNLQQVFGIRIPIRCFPTHELIFTRKLEVLNCSGNNQGGNGPVQSPSCSSAPPVSDEALLGLRRALEVEVDVLPKNLDVVEGVASRQHTHHVLPPLPPKHKKVLLSVLQFYSLLDLFGSSPPVVDVLRRFGLLPHGSSSDSVTNPIELLRIGMIPEAPTDSPKASLCQGLLGLTLHPTATYALQLQHLLASSTKNAHDVNGTDEKSLERRNFAAKAFDVLGAALQLQKLAKEAVDEGNHAKAVQLLTLALKEKGRKSVPRRESKKKKKSQSRKKKTNSRFKKGRAAAPQKGSSHCEVPAHESSSTKEPDNSDNFGGFPESDLECQEQEEPTNRKSQDNEKEEVDETHDSGHSEEPQGTALSSDQELNEFVAADSDPLPTRCSATGDANADHANEINQADNEQDEDDSDDDNDGLKEFLEQCGFGTAADFVDETQEGEGDGSAGEDEERGEEEGDEESEGNDDVEGQDEEFDVENDVEAVSGESDDAKNEAPLCSFLPVHLKVSLLSQRIESSLQMSDVVQAMSDCCAVLEMDPRHSKAYALRSQITAALHELDHEEIDAAGISSELLEFDISHDALAAFLLSGCMDLQLAAAAEEAAREACRSEAKKVYLEQQQQEDLTVLSPSLSAVSTLPKAWLVRSYFSGYSLLFDSMSIASGGSTEISPLCTFVDAAVDVASTCVESLHDIDEAAQVGKGDEQGTLPPLNLLEYDLMNCAETSCSVPSKTDLAEEKESKPKVTASYVVLPHDARAFMLLRDLANLVDGNTIRGVTDFDAAKVKLQTARLSEEEEDTSDVSCVIPDLASSGQDLVDFLDASMDDFVRNHGICDPVESTLEGFSDIKEPEAELMESLIRKTEKLVLKERMDELYESGSLMGDHDTEEMEGIILEQVEVAPCPVFLEILRKISLPNFAEVVGVRFTEIGRISSIDEVTAIDFPESLEKELHSKVADLEEEEWEDCDDEDDELEEEEDENEETGGSVDGNDDVTNQRQLDEFVKTVSKDQRTRKISWCIQARLFNLFAGVAYIAGDAIGAVKCLRSSLAAFGNARLIERLYFESKGALASDDPETKLAVKKFEVDCLIKLAALLTDMDEIDEATKLFEKALLLDPENVPAMLHFAELHIQNNAAASALTLLKKAKHSVRQALLFQSFASTERENMTNLAQKLLFGNVYSLLGVAEFRNAPNVPEMALRTLEEGVEMLPGNVYLQLCLGEILSQVGDAIGSLAAFQRAAAIDKHHPLPFVNAARTYQQLGQQLQAMKHVTRAVSMDPALSMTRVDLAQQYLHSGRTSAALATLKTALRLAHHVGEIRDVLTARKIALLQLQLQQEGLHSGVI